MNHDSTLNDSDSVSAEHKPEFGTRAGSMAALRRSDAAVLTKKEVATLFGVNERTVDRAVEEGALSAIRLGRRVLFPREPLLAMLTTGRSL